jgi:hypothetical protein
MAPWRDGRGGLSAADLSTRRLRRQCLGTRRLARRGVELHRAWHGGPKIRRARPGFAEARYLMERGRRMPPGVAAWGDSKKVWMSPNPRSVPSQILRRVMEGFSERRISPSSSEGELPMKNNVLNGKKAPTPTQEGDAALNGAPAAGAVPEGQREAGAPVPPGGAAPEPEAGAAAGVAPKAGSAAAPADAGSPEPTETLDERDARRIRELAEHLKMVRSRRRNRRVASQKVLLKKSTSEMTAYVSKLAAGAKFTIDVLVRVGAKAEELGLSPADLFAKLGEAVPPKQK